MAGKSVFDWDKEKFTTHIDAMDSEHEVLIGIMNKLYQENESGASKTQLLATIQKLGAFTKQHFEHEEAMFTKLPNYKSVASHKKIHENLLTDFATHVEAFKKSSDVKVPDKFFLFLKVWLSAHICGVDRKYGEIAKAG